MPPRGGRQGSLIDVKTKRTSIREHEPATGGTGGFARGGLREEERGDTVPDLLRSQVCVRALLLRHRSE